MSCVGIMKYNTLVNNDVNMSNTLCENIGIIQKQISGAALKAGRRPEDITLIAITKTVSHEKIKQAMEFGLRIFGENRVQEAKEKIINLSEKDKSKKIEWHLVGHLQKNKAKPAVELFDMIHSVDSVELAEELDKHAKKINKKQNILAQVKLSEEETKHGILKENLLQLTQKVSQMENLELSGLMTIPPFFEDAEMTRPFFRKLRELRDDINSKGFHLKELLMGMTNDFKTAIEEGATMVRIGTGIFGQRVNLEVK